MKHIITAREDNVRLDTTSHPTPPDRTRGGTEGRGARGGGGSNAEDSMKNLQGITERINDGDNTENVSGRYQLVHLACHVPCATCRVEAQGMAWYGKRHGTSKRVRGVGCPCERDKVKSNKCFENDSLHATRCALGKKHLAFMISGSSKRIARSGSLVAAVASPLVVYAGGIIIERVKQSGLELDLHGVVRPRAFLLDMDHPPESALPDTLDVQEVVRRNLDEKHRCSTEAGPQQTK